MQHGVNLDRRHLYLIMLLRSHEMFQAGTVAHVHHLQKYAYYKRILAGTSNVALALAVDHGPAPNPAMPLEADAGSHGGDALPLPADPPLAALPPPRPGRVGHGLSGTGVPQPMGVRRSANRACWHAYGGSVAKLFC